MTRVREIWQTIRVAFKAASLNGLAVFTAVYTLQDGLNFTVPEVSASMVNGAAGLFAFTGWLAFDVKRRRGVLRDSAVFFGFRRRRRLTLILSSYAHVVEYTGDRTVRERRYYKIDPDTKQKRYVLGAYDHVMGTQTVAITLKSVKLISSLPEISVDANADEKLVLHLPESLSESEATLVCLGSPGTNSIARILWKQLPIHDNGGVFQVVEKC